MGTVLLVDDDAGVREVAGAYLRREGFEVLEAADGREALRLAAAERPALVVLDLMLPLVSGLDVFRRLRAESSVPVVMLTARGEEADRVLGLELGADDYLTKPFSPRELVARVRAVLRRSAGEVQPAPVLAGPLRVDPAARTVTLDGRPVELSALEFDLLLALASSPDRAFRRDDLIRRVWGEDFPGVDRVVDVHVSSLRRRLGDDPDAPRLIATVRGVGYRFVGGGR